MDCCSWYQLGSMQLQGQSFSNQFFPLICRGYHCYCWIVSQRKCSKSSFCSAQKLMYSSTALINIFGCTYNFLLNQCEGQQWARCRESQISSIFCCSGEFGFVYNCCDRSYCCAITAPCHQLCLHWWCNCGQRGLRPLSILGRHSYPQWGPTSIVW